MMDEMIKLLRDLADWRGVYRRDYNGLLFAEDKFYRETFLFPPGRSIPMAMAGGADQDYETRRKAWDEWVKKENEALNDRLRMALELVGASMVKCEDCSEWFWPSKPCLTMCPDCEEPVERQQCADCVHRKWAGHCEVFKSVTIDAHDGRDCGYFEKGDGLLDSIEEVEELFRGRR